MREIGGGRNRNSSPVKRSVRIFSLPLIGKKTLQIVADIEQLEIMALASWSLCSTAPKEQRT